MTTISLSWSTCRDPDGPGWYVLEQGEYDGNSIRFGPMPGNVVEAFIKIRRQCLEREVKKHGNAIRIFNAPNNIQ